ncbi:MAG: NYN domain-containing protein [Actinobacteria bacterium]|nr:NYN domain-containing protein [Actinomycetota bacterium]
MTDNGIPGVPEALLVPLLDTVADRLRDLAPVDVPLALRPLIGFDRRGLSRGAARQQLLRALETEEGFRAEMSERFLERPEVAEALEQWTPAEAAAHVEAAANRADLPLLTSALYAARPEGWAFGIGVIIATYERRRGEQAVDDDVKALQARVATLDEARRRAESARDDSASSVARLERELRDERRSRRAREEEARRQADVAARRADAMEKDLTAAREELDASAAKLQRERARVRGTEAELSDARREITRLSRELSDARSRDADQAVTLRDAEVEALANAAEVARRLAAGLGELAKRSGALQQKGTTGATGQATRHAESEPARGPRDGEPERRAPRLRVPGGLVADSPEGVEALLRTPGLVLVVDGYNLSMHAWPDAAPSVQRERLLAALSQLQLRVRRGVVCVFDGADVGTIPSPRRGGVRVIFSAPGEDADPVVVREAATYAKRTPVLVVSSDRWVRDHAEAGGALAVGAPALLAVLRG